jgi:hypothetical protein
MLAQINPSLISRASRIALLACAASVLASCATKPAPQLVDDPSGGPESTLPWNKQEKWEGRGQLGAAAEQFGQDRR